jgi:membrane protein/epoxyqueuosine reductase
MLTALNRQWLSLGSSRGVQTWIDLFLFKLAAIPISILALFLVYWLLPNRKIAPSRVAPIAIVVGLILESLKYVNLAVRHLMETKLDHEYAIFRHSVTILLWSFVAALAVLAGAEFASRRERGDPVS